MSRCRSSMIGPSATCSVAGLPTGRCSALPGQRGHVVVVDRLVHDVPAGGHADLALVQERAPGAGRGRLGHVGVVHHDHGRVAAEFQVAALEVGGGKLAHMPAHGGGAGERDHPDQRVGDQRLAGVGAAGQHMQQALGQPGLLEHPGQHDAAADRGARVRLEHHRVAQRQRGRHRADGQDLREVERGDHADHADRDPLGEAQVRRLAGQQLTVGARGQRGRLVDLLGGDVRLELGRRGDLAALADAPLLDLVGVGLPDVARTAQHRGPLGVRGRGPGRLGGRRRGGRGGHVGGRRDAGPAEFRAGGRFDDRRPHRPRRPSIRPSRPCPARLTLPGTPWALLGRGRAARRLCGSRTSVLSTNMGESR